jgi:single-strand DNA-binding protein
MANQIQLVMYEGYMAENPEMRYTPSGKAVTNFRMGSNRKWKNANGEDVKETTWLKIAAWGKLGEIVNQYCEKGSHVIVTGILRVGKNGSPEVYELSNGGHGASYEITAREVRILKGKTGDAQVMEESPVSDEDIPF